MFGNFIQNFGFEGFPFQGVDSQGGLFGQNAPMAAPETGTVPPPAAGGSPQGGPAAPLPASPTAPAPPAAGPAPSPLGSPLAPGQGAPQQPAPAGGLAPGAPAAGVGSPFQAMTETF